MEGGDLEGRPLRPIGVTARDIASRTGLLLAQLINMPSVRVFHGVRVPGSKPPVAHAVAQAMERSSLGTAKARCMPWTR